MSDGYFDPCLLFVNMNSSVVLKFLFSVKQTKYNYLMSWIDSYS